jgi:mono/diheme cytochrome c family protein
MVREAQSIRAFFGGISLLLLINSAAFALDGAAIVTERCLSCHNITGPAPSTLSGVLERKAPDLFYAGSKFNKDWLAEWLQKPTVIRHSGVMFLNHITNEGGKDIIRQQSIKPCPAKLSAEKATTVTDYLMTLTDSRMKTGVVDAKAKFRKSKARRLFTKQLPCIACHTAKLGKRTRGGISGPDLTQAGSRLNPDWVYARIENPQYWDPKTWMPKFELSHKKRELLAQFISSMK